MITLFWAAVAVILLGGLFSLGYAAQPKRAALIATGGIVLGCLLGLVPALGVLFGNLTVVDTLACRLPVGDIAVRLDPLAGFFLLPVLLLSPLTVVYGVEYLRAHASGRNGAHWFWFSIFVVGMVLVLAAADSLFFLLAWEGMTVASYFLVVTDDNTRGVREAGLLYLVLSHVGVTCLMAMFILLGGRAGETDFSRLVLDCGSMRSAAIFILALCGFGLKAGLVPLHVWLPKAHPAAPSHVSAVMSGVMIKLGIYGLLRIVSMADAPPLWWGGVLVAVGGVSAVYGALQALVQADLKRLLAYCSVENIGIIVLGLGVGLVGVAIGSDPLAALGFAGCLLQVINHSICKGLLFFGAGAVQQATGTRQIDRLGGLLKRMPGTGTAFLVGALAICGLPPLNCFIGEFIVYFACFREGALIASSGVAALLFAAMTALALSGVLAAGAFAKAVGCGLLGEPRSREADEAREVAVAIRMPPIILSAFCIALGVFIPLGIAGLSAPLGSLVHLSGEELSAILVEMARPLGLVAFIAGLLLLLVVIIALLRRRLLSRRDVRVNGTWDCGYVKLGARMQYTAASFGEPVRDLFRRWLGEKRRFRKPEGLFPQSANLQSEFTDSLLDRIYQPLLSGLRRGSNRFKILQHGNTHVYVLYIALTLLVFLFWKLG